MKMEKFRFVYFGGGEGGAEGNGIPHPPATRRNRKKKKNKTPSGQSNLESKLEASHFLISNYTIKLIK